MTKRTRWRRVLCLPPSLSTGSLFHSAPVAEHKDEEHRQADERKQEEERQTEQRRKQREAQEQEDLRKKEEERLAGERIKLEEIKKTMQAAEEQRKVAEQLKAAQQEAAQKELERKKKEEIPSELNMPLCRVVAGKERVCERGELEFTYGLCSLLGEPPIYCNACHDQITGVYVKAEKVSFVHAFSFFFLTRNSVRITQIACAASSATLLLPSDTQTEYQFLLCAAARPLTAGRRGTGWR